VAYWKCEVLSLHAQLEPEQLETLYTDKTGGRMYGYFVCGIKGYLLEGINVGIGLANKSEVVYHSLYFEDKSDQHHYWDRMQAGAPGEFVEIPPPSAVCVSPILTPQQLESWPEDATLLPRKQHQKGKYVGEKRIVVPVGLLRKKDPVYVSTPGRLTHPKTGKLEPLKVRPHGIEPALVITYYHVLGANLKAVILDLNKNKRKPLTWEDAYVGMTRVTAGNLLRILPVPKQQGLHHLLKLRQHPDLAVYEAGIPEGGGVWVASASKAEAERLGVPLDVYSTKTKSLFAHGSEAGTGRAKGGAGRATVAGGRRPGGSGSAVNGAASSKRSRTTNGVHVGAEDDADLQPRAKQARQQTKPGLSGPTPTRSPGFGRAAPPRPAPATFGRATPPRPAPATFGRATPPRSAPAPASSS
jgi:hypothetical protein